MKVEYFMKKVPTEVAFSIPGIIIGILIISITISISGYYWLIGGLTTVISGFIIYLYYSKYTSKPKLIMFKDSFDVYSRGSYTSYYFIDIVGIKKVSFYNSDDRHLNQWDSIEISFKDNSKLLLNLKHLVCSKSAVLKEFKTFVDKTGIAKETF